ILARQRLFRGGEVEVDIEDALIRAAARARIGPAFCVSCVALDADEFRDQRHRRWPMVTYFARKNEELVTTPEQVLKKTIQRCAERKIVVPTFAQLRDPSNIPPDIKARLKGVAMNAVDPANLFRITWKNEPVETGGGFNHGNWIEFPSALTGVSARIIGLVGRHFPTGAHKVGAAFGCLVPRLVSGQFDPTTQKAVWPSTGNYCRGGAFDSALLGCTPIAILPEQMSRERFEWLKSIGAEVITTPGGESNVKEIYDKCWDIKTNRKDCVIFNQFEEFG